MPEAQEPPKIARPKVVWLRLAVLAGLILFLYQDVLFRLIGAWSTDPNFSHGFFVPLFSAYLVWQRRKQLALVQSVPATSALLVICGALTMLVVGTLGSELFLSRLSFVFLLAGIVLYLRGWRYFRILLFPWLLLFLMVPLPAIIFNRVTFQLQLLATGLATNVLRLMQVPVLREGNIIQLAALPMEVAEACSGIRSLLSLGTLAIIYGYFLESKMSRRALFALAAVPIAVVANALRIVGTGLLVQRWDPEKALGFFHDFSGWVIFLCSLAMLFLFQKFMRLFDRPSLDSR